MEIIYPMFYHLLPKSAYQVTAGISLTGFLVHGNLTSAPVAVPFAVLVIPSSEDMFSRATNCHLSSSNTSFWYHRPSHSTSITVPWWSLLWTILGTGLYSLYLMVSWSKLGTLNYFNTPSSIPLYYSPPEEP